MSLIVCQGEEIGMKDGFISWEDTVDPSACNTDDPINYVQTSRDPERTPFQWNSEKNAGQLHTCESIEFQLSFIYYTLI